MQDLCSDHEMKTYIYAKVFLSIDVGRKAFLRASDPTGLLMRKLEMRSG